MRKIISSLSLIVIGLNGLAGVLTPEDALDRAMSITSGKSFMQSKAKSSAMQHIATREAGGLPAVYVFSSAETGNYFIVSADDEVQPLLGYGGTGFAPEDINPAMEWWLEEYAEQIKWIRENNQGEHNAASATDRPTIEPMIKTRWDQDEPYNYLCPTYSGIEYLRCPTGCAATAMAQLLYYYKYSTTAFDWSNMLESYSGSYTDAQRNAVAKLMAECGSASRTVYNSYGSSAGAQDIMNGLATLGYDKYVANPYMNNYSVEGWNALVYEQLRDFGPTIVLGFYGRTGHAFLCDGYDGNGYFHINWGWGGRSDGYFTLTAMTPDEQGSGGSNGGGYNSNVSLIANICPATFNVAPRFFLAVGKWRAKVSEIALGEEFSIISTIQNRNNRPFSGAIGYKLVDEKTSMESYHVIDESAYISGGRYISGLQATIPADVSEGDYRMYLVWRVQDNDDWTDVPVLNYYSPYINVHVEGDVAYFSEAKGVDLSLGIDTFETPFFSGCDFTLTASVVNKGIGDYNNVVYVVLFGEDGATKYAYGSNHSLLLLSGQSTEFEYSSKFSNYRGMTVEPGKYNLAFVDNYDAIISDLYPIEIQTKPDTSGAEIEVLEDGTAFVGDKDKADKNNIDIAVNVKSNGGYFIGQVWAKFFETGANYTENVLYSKTLYVPQGESQIIHVKGAVPALEAGRNYDIELYSKKGRLTNNIATVHIEANTTGIYTADKGGIDIILRELFTLTGMRVNANHTKPGIYIERITYADGTVISQKKLIQ